MEAQDRTLGVFPSYNGPALPQAIRSVRGKGEISKRQSNCAKRPGFFELLATVAGQFLQNDGIVQKDNRMVENDTSKNDVKPMIEDIKTLHSMQVYMHQSSKDFMETSKIPQTIDKFSYHKQRVEIGCSGNHNCAKLSKYNSFLLHELPIPSFIKDIMKNETIYQSNVVSHSQLISTSYDNQNKTDFEFQNIMLIDHNTLPTIIEERNCTIDNNEHVISKDLTLKNLNVNGTQIHLNQIEHLVFPQHSKSNEQLYTLDQLHDPICQSCNLYHNLGMNFETVKTMNGSFEDNDVLLHKFDATFQSFCTKKTNFEPLENNLTNVNLNIMDDNQNLIGESMTIDQTHVDCKNHCKFMKSLENKQYFDPKQIEDLEVLAKNPIYQGQSKFDKKEKTKGHRSSQRLIDDAMTKKNLEENLNGSKSCRMPINCNIVTELKTMPSKEDDVKPTDNVASTKQTFFNGIAAFTRQRTSRRLPLKRKRLEDGDKYSPKLHLKTNNPMDLGCDGIYGEPPAAAAKLRSAKAASVASSPTTKRATKSFTKRIMEPHVKFGINSFIIPEFFVDLPESASILTLKRAIMDAAVNLLGGGLRVRVLMNGKKIVDEGTTLLQSGISRNLKPETLGFMLEPSPIPTSPTITHEDPFLVLSRLANLTSPRFQAFGISNYPQCQEIKAGSRGIGYDEYNSDKVIEGCSLHDEDPLFSQFHVGGVDQQTTCMSGKKSTITISYSKSTTTMYDDPLKDNNINVGKTTTTKSNLTERIALSPHSTRIAAVGALAAIRAQADANRRLKNNIEMPLLSNNHTVYDGCGGGSGAIILHPSMGVRDSINGLALVSVQQKSRSLDIGKRRVRRPFSVAEVEALVYAVEKLGTGRWRDVKLRAFEQSKHRTYVDLKDKWKTLVHTARIAPHQRRGEPVPQELLERVTCAHIYWTAQAAKQQADLDF